MRILRDKRVLLTGAASGIGRAVARRLAAEGSILFLVDIDGEGLDRLEEELRAGGARVTTCLGDLSDPAQVSEAAAAAVRTMGGVDLLINNAGIAWYGATYAMPHDVCEKLLRVNLLSPIQLTRELLPAMIDRGDCHVVFMSSIFGLLTHRRTAAYHASKYGLVGFGGSLRDECSRLGLGVTVLCPGFVRTNLYSAAGSANPGRLVGEPPSWIKTDPEHVAEALVKAVRRDRGLVVITPFARLLHAVKRFAPFVLEFIQRLDRRRSLRKRAALRQREVSASIPVTESESGGSRTRRAA